MAARLSGAAGRKGRAIEQIADINVTPFVDIMLVLLIIFMVSIPLATVSVKLDVPPSSDTAAPHKPTVIRVLDDGGIALTGAETRATTLATLPGDLSAALTRAHPGVRDPRTNAILVSADADVKYDRFMAVMNTLRDTGYSKIGLVTEDIK
jgi:biopolymer transport protein ExbD